MPKRLLIRLTLAALLAAATVMLILGMVTMSIVWWAFVTYQDWSAGTTLAVFCLPFVVLLTLVFAWGGNDA